MGDEEGEEREGRGKGGWRERREKSDADGATSRCCSVRRRLACEVACARPRQAELRRAKEEGERRRRAQWRARVSRWFSYIARWRRVGSEKEEQRARPIFRRRKDALRKGHKGQR